MAYSPTSSIPEEEVDTRSSLKAFVDDPRSSTAAAVFQASLLFLIVASSAAVILETLPEFRTWKFLWLEAIVTVIFTIELALRLCVADSIVGFFTNGFNLVDVVAVLPGYFEFFFGGDTHTLHAVLTLRVLRIMWFIRILRLLKELGLPCKGFESIPASFWFAICTLTTVGYGDVIPFTRIGRVLAAFITVCAVIIMALAGALIYFNFYELLPQRTVPHVDENKENPQAKLLEEPSVCFIGHSTGVGPACPEDERGRPLRHSRALVEVLGSYCKVFWTLALSLFDDLHLHSLQPDRFSLANIVVALDVAWQSSLALLQGREALADVVVYSALMRSCERAHAWEVPQMSA
eukprot:s2964_g5.t3